MVERQVTKQQRIGEIIEEIQEWPDDDCIELLEQTVEMISK